jgi:RNA polymerase sigma-70 factor (ECF subfamily)
VETDEDLLVRLRAGDESAFEALVERYHPRLIRFALSFASRRELAEDVVQETWIGLLRGLDRFEGRSSLGTWLFQICANRARSMAAQEARIIPVGPQGPAADPALFRADGAWAEPVAAWADPLTDAADQAELIERIRRAIDDLPPGQRQVVTLRDVEGMTAAQVCEIMSITEVNQRVLLHRGRTRVRAVLDRLGKEVTH